MINLDTLDPELKGILIALFESSLLGSLFPLPAPPSAPTLAQPTPLDRSSKRIVFPLF